MQIAFPQAASGRQEESCHHEGVNFELTAAPGKLPSKAHCPLCPCNFRLSRPRGIVELRRRRRVLPAQPFAAPSALQSIAPHLLHSFIQGVHRGFSLPGSVQEGCGPMHRHDLAFNRPPRSNRCSVPLPILPSASESALMIFQCALAGRWRPCTSGAPRRRRRTRRPAPTPPSCPRAAESWKTRKMVSKVPGRWRRGPGRPTERGGMAGPSAGCAPCGAAEPSSPHPTPPSQLCCCHHMLRPCLQSSPQTRPWEGRSCRS